MEKVFTYKPRAVALPGGKDLVGPTFTGEIKLAIPDWQSRIDLIKEYMPQDGGDEASSGGKMIDLVKKYVREVDFKHPECDEPLKSVDDLSYFAEGNGVILDLGKQIMQGWSLNPKP